MKSLLTDSPTGGGLLQAARSLQIQLVAPAQFARFEALLAQKHYLGSLASVGDFLRQVVVREGQWVVLLVWGPAALKLKDRERWMERSRTMRIICLLIQCPSPSEKASA